LDLSKFEPKLNGISDLLLNRICNQFGSTKYDQNCITRLDLSQNNLKTVNGVVFQLKSLKQLKLNDNRIESLGDTKFQSNALEDLDVSSNCLTEIPANLFLLKSLKHLNLSSNQITEIPFSLWQCKSLVEFNVSFNAVNCLPFKCQNFRLLVFANEKSHAQPTRITSNTPNVDTAAYYAHKPLVKINIWTGSCESGLKNSEDFNLNDEMMLNAHTDSNDNSQYYSNIIDLNLAHNCFDDVPSCLACLMPKLLKLNLSFNKLKAMGRRLCDGVNQPT
jgi:hypothetical protein